MHSVKEARCLGSLFGDVERMAESVAVARAECDVMVWLNPQGQMICSGVESAPNLHAEYLVGTYGVGANAADIREDLIAFRKERVSNAMIF